MEIHAFLVPRRREGEVAAVRCNGVQKAILHCNIWRVVLERIVHVYVIGLAISLHFEARGDFYIVPRRNVHIISPKSILAGALVGRCNPIQFPSTIQRKILGVLWFKPGIVIFFIGLHFCNRRVRHICGVPRFFVILEECFILPHVAHWNILGIHKTQTEI